MDSAENWDSKYDKAVSAIVRETLTIVEGFYGDMEWQLSLNPYQKMFFNL